MDQRDFQRRPAFKGIRIGENLKNEEVPEKNQNHDGQKRHDADRDGFLPIPFRVLDFFPHRGDSQILAFLAMRATV